MVGKPVFFLCSVLWYELIFCIHSPHRFYKLCHKKSFRQCYSEPSLNFRFEKSWNVRSLSARVASRGVQKQILRKIFKRKMIENYSSCHSIKLKNTYSGVFFPSSNNFHDCSLEVLFFGFLQKKSKKWTWTKIFKKY